MVLLNKYRFQTKKALEFINSYFKKFPEIKEYMHSTVKFCRKNGYVNNIFGRRIHLRGINDKNFSVRSFQERAAINAPIQSSAADLIRIAMIKLNELNKSKKPSMQKCFYKYMMSWCLNVQKKNKMILKKL